MRKRGQDSYVTSAEKRDSAWGRETPIFMKTIKFAGTHDPHEEARRARGRARD